MPFICATCGQEHDIDDLSFGAHEPFQWNCLSDSERAQSILTGEQCEIISSEGRSFYIRASLEIPIRNTNRHFVRGVWCSLSEKSYLEVSQHWNDPDRTKYGPYFGWLCTSIPDYPDTAFLKTKVHIQDVGSRPYVELEPTDHLLAVDQREGIEESRLKKMVVGLLHRYDWNCAKSQTRTY